MIRPYRGTPTIAIPDSWDEGEETADDIYGTANEESTTKGDESEHGLPGLDDSLPELVSDKTETSEDSRYDFINMPTNDESKDFEAMPEDSETTPEDYEEANETTEEQEEKRDEEQKEVNIHKDISENNEEAQLQEPIDFILNMEDPNYKDPEPCTGLTCPLTGEQYYVD